MAVYSDAVGNRYIGNYNYSAGTGTANSDTTFATNFGADIATIFTQTGMSNRNILTQANITSAYSASGAAVLLGFFAPQGDTIDDRYSIILGYINATLSTTSYIPVGLYPNGGATYTGGNVLTNTSYTGGIICGASGIAGTLNVVTSPSSSTLIANLATGTITGSDYQIAGVADNKSLALFFINYNASGNIWYHFYYIGEVTSVNTNFNYYSGSVETRTVLIHNAVNAYTSPSTFYNASVGHRITSTSRSVLTTGDAQYAISCSDGQTPTAQWATDFYVFDNNSSIGFPAIGRMRNLLLATGTYTMGKTVKIIGAAMPDAGQNSWIPVATFAGKTVLMRCYSSTV